MQNHPLEISAENQDVASTSGVHSVLLVDDNEVLLETLQDLLGQNGFGTSVARTAGEARWSLETNLPQLIICDIELPDMSGREFYESILLDTRLCNVPFVFLSACAAPEEVLQAKLRGCDDYLTKPFSTDELLAVVKGKIALAATRKAALESQTADIRRRIIQTLSHEFRTPLVSISTGTELLMEHKGALEDEQVRHLLHSIQRGGQRLQRLVDDFVTLQQIDAGMPAASQKRAAKESSLLRIAEVAVLLFQESGEYPQREIELIDSEAASDIFSVFVFDAQVIDVLRRVLNNACKFSDEHTVVKVWTRSESTRCSVFVRDYGLGMSPKSAEKARELFVQIDRGRFEQQGCGIGLAIANYYTTLNGGELLFRAPEQGVGLEVELRFPTFKV